MEGHLRQYTEARTTEVPLGRDGMYYQEFHACFDWIHHGEAWSPIFLHGLSDPGDRALVRRMRRWAGLYMAEDPHIPNYDPQHRVIRSLLQWVARAPAAAGDGARLGGRPHRGGGPVPDLATAKPRTRRCSTTSATTPTSSATTR